MTVLTEKVLVLNKSWLPINVATVRDAIGLVYTESARIVHPTSYEMFDFESWKDAGDFAKDAAKYLHGCDWKMLVPEVIVLTNYKGINKRQVKFSRRNLFERDKNTCQYCGKRLKRKNLTIDHVLPKSRGGKSTWDNVILACISCNKRKDNRTPKEAKMRLLKKPRQPKWEEVQVGGMRGPMPVSWQSFLSEMYWNVELED